MANFANAPGNQYFVVGPEMRITNIARAGNDIQVTWLTGTNSNLVYQLEATGTITNTAWTNLGSPTNGVGAAVTQTVPNALTNTPAQFYRVRESMGGCP